MHHVTVKRFAVFIIILLGINILLFAYIVTPK